MAEAEVRFLTADRVSSTLGKVEAAAVVAGHPARSFPPYKGQRNYYGLLWTATTGTLVGYESLLERDLLWLADFDPAVRRICGQPFLVDGPRRFHSSPACAESFQQDVKILRSAAFVGLKPRCHRQCYESPDVFSGRMMRWSMAAATAPARVSTPSLV